MSHCDEYRILSSFQHDFNYDDLSFFSSLFCRNVNSPIHFSFFQDQREHASSRWRTIFSERLLGLFGRDVSSPSGELIHVDTELQRSGVKIVGSWTPVSLSDSVEKFGDDTGDDGSVWQDKLRYSRQEVEVIREDIYQKFLGQGFYRDKHVRAINILFGSWQFDEDVLSVLRVHQTYADDNERSEYRAHWTSWQGMMKSKRDKMILSDMT